MLRVYNTMSGRKEELRTRREGEVGMYVCGPTVYNFIHVGNGRAYLVFDVIKRYLRYKGYRVLHVQNFTDVDDKIINRAAEEGVAPQELARRYEEAFRRDMRDLHVLPPDVTPRATEYVEKMVKVVEALVEKGHAYEVEGDVYFSVTSFPGYGKLSKRNLEEMRAGERVEVDPRKGHPMDFALWKRAKPGEPAWDSPWGPGRPGWHIECSAMNLTHLGEQIDIHGGGNDLIFPHHENEIAQTESFTGKPFARYWVHNGMLQLGGEKMSKSLGNLVTIEEFLREHDADVLRLMVLNSGYRNPLTFNDEVIEQTERTLERLKSALRPALPGAKGLDEESARNLAAQAEETREGFIRAMDDDFNSAVALSHLFELVRAINQARTAGATDADLQAAQGVLRELAGVLGLRLQAKVEESHAADPFIDLLVEVRTELRKQKLWALSDLVRDRLAALGVILEDSKEGTTWRYQK